MIGDTVNASIGQGYVLTSPLQLAVMTARLATGRTIAPRLVKSVDGVELPPRPAPISDSIPKTICGRSSARCSRLNNRRGTAYGSRIIADAMRMAGKTGTSQVRNITAAERARGVTSNEDLPWNRRDHALFVNYAPYDQPRIAVAVVVEHGGGGSTAAAPIARDVTLQALYGDNPPLDAYPRKDRAASRRSRNASTGNAAPARSRGAAHELSRIQRQDGPRRLAQGFYLNWPLVVLLTAVAGIGFLMLYSVAGGSFSPWAEPQMKRYALGLAVMFVVAMVPIWFWRNMALLAYLVALVLLVLVEFFGTSAWARSAGSISASCGCNPRN